MLRYLLVVIFVSFFSAGIGSADPFYQFVRKIPNPNGPIEGSGDEFGISIAQVGQNVVVGAYRDDTGAVDAGAVYVFDRDGGLITTIHNPTPERDDWFGKKVAAVQDRILIAARNDSTAGFDTGSVYLYDQQGNLLQTIPNPTPGLNDDFGINILGIGDKIFVTSIRDDTLADNSGAAYLFDQEGQLIQEFFSPAPVANGRFGRFSSNMGNEGVLTSAFAQSVGGVIHHGATYLFDLQGNVLQTFSNPKPHEANFFGGRVIPLGGELVAISAFEDNATGIAAGTVYIYDLEGNLQHSILNPTPEFEDWFGRTMVRVGEGSLLIGATFDNSLGIRTGAAYLYDSTGGLVQTFLPPEPAPDGHFSLDMATFDDLILIGSHFDGGGFIGPGAVYVYAPLPTLAGDYNADQSVDQADLDLVLLNWGVDASDRSDGWVRNLPHALIDQQELDSVLLNWGQTSSVTISSNGVPEPATLMLGFFAAGIAIARALGRR